MLKRNGLFIIIFLFTSFYSYGQAGVTDSILSIISEMHDSVKLRILKDYALGEQYRSLRTGLVYADKRMEIARKINDSEKIAETFHIYGNLYTNSGLLNSAEENYLKALSISDSLNLNETSASILHNLGLVYFKKKDTLRSIEYYKESIALRKKALDSKRIGDELTTLGETYLSYEDYEKSVQYLLEALEYYRNMKGYGRKLETYAFLFDTYYVTGEQGSMRWIDSMKIENNILSSEHYKSMINLRLVRLHILNDNLNLAENYLDSINFELLYNSEINEPVDVFFNLSEQYLKKGNQRKAIDYRLSYRKHKSEMIHREVQDLVSDYNVRLSIRASEEEIEWSKKQNELILKRMRIEKTISFIIYFALGITFIVLLYLIYSVISIRITNKKLVQRRAGLQEAYERSTKYKERILSIRENKNDFFSIVSLKLSRPFNGLTHRLTEISSYLKDNNKDLKLKTMMEVLHKEASGIEKGLERILLWSKLQRNKYMAEFTAINLNDFLHEMLPSLLGIALKKDIRLRFDIDPELNIMYDRFSLKTIIMILTENSIDHSSPKSDIIIRAEKAKSDCLLSVTDFGSGIPADLQNRIFDIRRVKDESSHYPDKIGLGLLIVKLMVEKNNSTISLESKEYSGTTFFIHINNRNER
ncbi:MAG: tetratricopeptide repeat-containing sensor histidine kinase [Bacteroidales bacterium]|nr:tetratricopeptide repeat-containing sensor histidine kinase [Bacteroidales bacterium]